MHSAHQLAFVCLGARSPLSNRPHGKIVSSPAFRTSESFMGMLSQWGNGKYLKAFQYVAQINQNPKIHRIKPPYNFHHIKVIIGSPLLLSFGIDLPAARRPLCTDS